MTAALKSEKTYFVALNGKQAGPLAAAEVQKLISEGQIKSDTLVIGEGMAAWQPLSQFAEFNAGASFVPPPLPPQLAVVPTQAVNLKFLAESALEAKNYPEAYAHYSKMLELNPSDVQAWHGKGLAAGYGSKLADLKTPEVMQCFSNAIKLSSPEELDKVRAKCAVEGAKLVKTFSFAITNHEVEFHSVRKDFDRLDDELTKIFTLAKFISEICVTHEPVKDLVEAFNYPVKILKNFGFGEWTYKEKVREPLYRSRLTQFTSLEAKLKPQELQKEGDSPRVSARPSATLPQAMLAWVLDQFNSDKPMGNVANIFWTVAVIVAVIIFTIVKSLFFGS